MIKRILLVLPVLLPFILSAQITLKGRVINQNNAKPLAGAHISLNNNLRTAISKQDGMFEINDLKPGKYYIVATYMGFSDWWSELEITKSSSMMIPMEPKVFELSEDVIIESTRAGETIPVTSTSLDSEVIERVNQGRDVPFILERMPSVVSSSDAGTGIGYSTFRVRGTDMNRINITVNGIPLNDAESHSVFWVNMPNFISNVSSLQVQRGVGSSTNGSAAFGASVNLQTEIPSSEPYAEISNSFGSFNTFNHSLAAGTGLINGKWAVDSRLSKLSSDGYIDRASADLKSFYVSGGYYTANTIVKLNVFSGLEKTYQAWDGVPSSLLGTDRTYNGIGYYTDKDGNEKYYDNETDNYQQDHYQLMLAQKISNNAILNFALHYTKGRGYYEQYKDDADLRDYGISPAVVYDTVLPSESDLIRRKHLDNDFYGYTFSLKYQPVNRLQLILGSSANIYDGDHFGRIIWTESAINVDPEYQWYMGTGVKKDLNIFTKANFQATSRLSIYGDLQIRTINYKITGTDDDLRDIGQEHDFFFFNPKAGLFYKLHSNGNLYASFAIAHREPNRDNYTDANPLGPDPVEERLYDYELGYNYDNTKTSINTTLYYMHYIDQLILTGDINDVGSPVMINTPSSYRMGAEFSIERNIFKSLSLSFNAAFSRNKIKNFVSKVDNWDTWEQISDTLELSDLAFSPNAVIGYELLWKPFEGFSASFDGKFVSKQFIDNTSSDDRTIDPYLVHNLRLGYSIKPSFIRELQFSLNFNNIFNTEYETNAWVYRYYSEGQFGKIDGYFPQAGINVTAGLTIKL